MVSFVFLRRSLACALLSSFSSRFEKVHRRSSEFLADWSARSLLFVLDTSSLEWKVSVCTITVFSPLVFVLLAAGLVLACWCFWARGVNDKSYSFFEVNVRGVILSS